MTFMHHLYAHNLSSLVEGSCLCMLLDKGMADIVREAVQAEKGLKDDVHVASVAQVGEPAMRGNEMKR